MKSSKKVLIILYYWPPAGGPGVQRWLKFVKYLPEFGFEPIVYCPERPNYPIIDTSLISEIPESLTILKQKIKEPYGLANLFSGSRAKKISSGIIPKRKQQTLMEQLMMFVRGNFFIPDARKNWVEPSVRFLSEYMTSHKIETIITTGPPHSLHLIGMKLKRQIHLKWIADFRDPWTTIGYHKDLKLTPSSSKKHTALELEVLQQADEIIVTSNHTKKEFQTKTNRPIRVITNGYDTHFLEIERKDKVFSLSHIGSLLSDRNPIILWEVLSELIQENSDFADKFQLQLIGVVSDDVVAAIRETGLDSHLKIIGYVNHQEALRYQMQSQLLLLVEIDSEETKAIIPGKLFEYLKSETPILAIGPPDSDIQQIISETNTGYYFNYNQKLELKSQILTYFETYKKGSLKAFPAGIERYSRRALTKKLASFI